MDDNHIALSHDVLSKVYPLHFVVNEDMRVIQVGQTLSKILSIKPEDSIHDFFTIKNQSIFFEFDHLKNTAGCIFLLEIIGKQYRLEGRILVDKQHNQLIFIGNVIADKLEDLLVPGLYIHDFLPQAPLFHSIFRDNNEEHQIIELLSKIIANSPNAVLVVDANNKVVLSNTPLQLMFDYTKSELLAMHPEDLFSERQQAKWKEHTQLLFSQPDTIEDYTLELMGLTRDGREFSLKISCNYIDLQEKSLLSCLFQDITEQNNNRRKIKKLLNFDPTTNLPNRMRFEKILNKRIALAKKEQKNFALLLINMNRLKFANDYYGHNIGDILLKKTGARIASQIRANDFLARLGSDEFIIIMDSEIPHQPGILAKRLLSAFEKPIQIMDYIINLSISIGITIFPSGGENETALLKNADIALYRAKSLKTMQFAYYSLELNEEHSSRLFIEHNLALAIKNEEFQLAFQPQVDLKTKKICGLEALLRWYNPEIGNISPDIFIPIAENEGLIGVLGMWVFEQVCIQLQQWKTTDIQIQRVSLNLSINQLSEPDLAHTFLKICRKYTIQPEEIDLEITETSIMSLESDALNILNELTKAGFTLSIDDFGSGYSSLSRLNKIPIKTLKIDKSLIQDTGVNAGKILLAIINLANNMELDVVAEGVDSQEKYEFLTKAGCKTGQGYYFYHPLPVDKLNHVLYKQHKTLNFRACP